MQPLLGAHVSVAGGYTKGVERGEALGAECIQIFGASPRQWAAPLPSAESVRAFRLALEKSPLKSVFLHAPYLVNLASPEVALIKKSIAALSTHLKIAEMLGAQGLIFHVGSGKEVLKPEAIRRSVAAMKEILNAVPSDTYLVMENSASHKKLGDTPEELGILYHQVKSDRLKVCIDTAHAFESGNIPEYTSHNIRSFFDQCDSAFGIGNLVALHANDSKTIAGSSNDRHENIGKGYIGLEGFKNLAKEPRLAHTSIFLEVPGAHGLGPDKENLDMLKRCFGRRIVK